MMVKGNFLNVGDSFINLDHVETIRVISNAVMIVLVGGREINIAIADDLADAIVIKLREGLFV